MWWQQQPISSELSSDTSPASPNSEYNPTKQYRPIVLYEWCYAWNWCTDAKITRNVCQLWCFHLNSVIIVLVDTFNKEEALVGAFSEHFGNFAKVRCKLYMVHPAPQCRCRSCARYWSRRRCRGWWRLHHRNRPVTARGHVSRVTCHARTSILRGIYHIYLSQCLD